MNAQMDSSVEFKECYAKVMALPAEQLDRNTRRVGLGLILAGAGLFKFSVFDVIMKHVGTQLSHASEPLYIVLLFTGVFLTGGMMLLYGGTAAARMFRINEKTGKPGFGALVASAVMVGSGIFFAKFVEYGAAACANAQF